MCDMARLRYNCNTSDCAGRGRDGTTTREGNEREGERERKREKEVDMQWLQDTSARQRRYGQSEYPDKAAVDSRIRAK